MHGNITGFYYFHHSTIYLGVCKSCKSKRSLPSTFRGLAMKLRIFAGGGQGQDFYIIFQLVGPGKIGMCIGKVISKHSKK